MLCLLLVPFYGLYWWYTTGEKVKQELIKQNYIPTGNGVLYLILGIFQLPIVSMAIMQADFNSFGTEANSEKKEKSEGEKTVVQAILFTLLSMVAFVSQIILVNVIPLIYKDTTPISAWIFGEQARNAFVAFLISNTAAKVISYVLNRKKTFAAVNNLTFSIVTYVIMCVTLIIVETLIGEPLAAAYFKLFGGKVKIDICRTISMITYSMLDFVIVFLMENSSS